MEGIKRNRLRIAIDFDGTITKSCGRFPQAGKIRPEAVKFINEWYDKGHIIIINSCRSKGEAEDISIDFLKENGVKYHYFNENDEENITFFGNDTRKISADLYFDDRSTAVNWNMFDAQVLYKERPTVICIIGESGGGKTLAAEYIEQEYGIKPLRSYTTREKRTPNESCHTFLSVEEFNLLPKEDMTALTVVGDDLYCCLVSDVEKKNTYVVSEESFVKFKRKFSNQINIISLRLSRDKHLREEKVGKKRVDRDKGMFRFPVDVFNFDHIIFNNSDKEFLFNHIDDFITKFELQ